MGDLTAQKRREPRSSSLGSLEPWGQRKRYFLTSISCQKGVHLIISGEILFHVREKTDNIEIVYAGQSLGV